MDRSAPSDPASDPTQLRPLFEQYFSPGGVDAEALHKLVCSVFCASAEAGIPVERALAGVNAEVDGLARGTRGSGDRMMALKRLIMMCCLDCYYPENSPGDGQRISA